MQGGSLELVIAVVEDDGWIQALAAERHLEMEMLCGGPASAARKTDYLACLHLIEQLISSEDVAAEAARAALTVCPAISGAWRRARPRLTSARTRMRWQS